MSLDQLFDQKIVDFLLNPALSKSALQSDKALAKAIRACYSGISEIFNVFGQKQGEQEQFWLDYTSKVSIENLLHKQKALFNLMLETQERFQSFLPEIGFKEFKELVKRTGLTYSWDGFIIFDTNSAMDIAKIRLLCKWFRLNKILNKILN